jgi:hypothetical protein
MNQFEQRDKLKQPMLNKTRRTGQRPTKYKLILPGEQPLSVRTINEFHHLLIVEKETTKRLIIKPFAREERELVMPLNLLYLFTTFVSLRNATRV